MYEARGAIQSGGSVGLSGLNPVQDAVQWIHEHYQRFLALGARIANMQARAAAAQDAADSAADYERARAADEIAGALQRLRARWAWTADRFRWIAEHVPGLGLGVVWIVPVAISAVAIVVAAGAALLMRQADLAEDALRMIEEGSLTPEQARGLGVDISGSPLFGFGGGFGTAIVAGAALYFWLGRRR